MQTLEYSRKNLVIATVAVFFCATAIYWQTAFFDFVWDDYGSIIHNEKIRSLQAASSTFYKRAGSDRKYDPAKLAGSNWRPLRTMVHAITYKFFAFEPFWYHLLNIIFQGLVAAMLFLLLARLTNELFPALVGALLFAVHPVNSEAVCWAKSLEDLMAALFLLLAFRLLLELKPDKSHINKNIGWGIGSCVAFILALTSKLSVVFFPVFLLLYLPYRKYLLKRRDESLTMPVIFSAIMLISAGAGALVRSAVLGKVAQCGYITGDIWTTWLSMGRVFLRYIFIELIPYPLYADYYNYPAAKSVSDPQAWLFMVLFVAVFAALTWLLYRKKLLGPWLWFWCALIPFANIIAMKQLGAERFLYLPTLGTAWLAAEIVKRNQNWKHIKLVVFVVLIIFSVLTVQRSRVWRDELALWTETAGQFPKSKRPRENLIKAYDRLGRPDLALPEAEALYNDYPTVENANLYGYVLCMNQRYQEGLKILKANKAHIILNIVGGQAAHAGKLYLARQCFQTALELSPGNPRYEHNLQTVERQIKAAGKQ